MGFQQLWRAGGGAGGKGGENRRKSWDGGLFGEEGRMSGKGNEWGGWAQM